MWFIGLIAGAILGLLSGNPAGALIGGIVGVVAALFYSESQRGQALYERRIVALEKAIRELRAQLATLTSQQSAAPTQTTAQPDAPVNISQKTAEANTKQAKPVQITLRERW